MTGGTGRAFPRDFFPRVPAARGFPACIQLMESTRMASCEAVFRLCRGMKSVFVVGAVAGLVSCGGGGGGGSGGQSSGNPTGHPPGGGGPRALPLLLDLE